MPVMVRVFLILGIFVSAADTAFSEIVKRVVDGDTVELSSGKTVHLIGIDAPENTENERAKIFARNSGKDIQEIIALGKKSERFLRGLLEGREVRLEFDAITEDKKGNLLAYVFEVQSLKGKGGFSAEGIEVVNGSEVFINATIVKSGYASPLAIPPNVKYSRLFKQLSIEAVKKKRGLWK